MALKDWDDARAQGQQMIAVRLAIFPHDERSEFAARMLAMALALALHLGLVASYALLNIFVSKDMPQGVVAIIELVPVPVEPASQQDVAFGPHMQAAAPPVLTSQARQELLEPLQKTDTALAATALAEPKPEKRAPASRPADFKPPAPFTTAPPRSQSSSGPVPAAPSSGSSHASVVPASWVNLLFSHLMRYRQYPNAAQERHEEGVVTLGFTMDRRGHVLARHVARGSGYPALDGEALAMLARAEPLPPFPPGMPEAARSFTAPIKFSLH
jgi:protein TonB